MPVDHGSLIAAIYDSVDAPGGFADLLDPLERLVDGTSSQLLVLGQGGAVLGNDAHGSDPASFVVYANHWRDRDPRMAYAMGNQGRVHSDVEVIDRPTFERSAIYNEHLLLYGGCYTLFVVAPASPDLTTGMAIMRYPQAGPFGSLETERVQALLPHLCRATYLRQLVLGLKDQVGDLQQALDVAPMTLAVLDGRGALLCANRAAWALLEERPGIHLERGMLTAARPRDAKALSGAITQTALFSDALVAPPSCDSRAVASVSIERERGAPLSLVFSPLRPRSCIRETASARARVLVTFQDPRARARIAPEIVTKLYGLTATEASLAAALVDGKTIVEFAASRGCSEETARTHAKRVLQKTGTKRQADLVRVLLAGAARHHLG